MSSFHDELKCLRLFQKEFATVSKRICGCLAAVAIITVKARRSYVVATYLERSGTIFVDGVTAVYKKSLLGEEKNGSCSFIATI